MIKKIKFTDGCVNNCEYCYEHKKIRFFYDPKIPKADLIQILDMNFLSNPRAKLILYTLPKGKYEFVCGVDYRRLDQEICNLMKKCGFIKIRWAWDYNFGQQRIHQKVWKMFLRAGYRPEELSVFMIVNWKIPFEYCCKKLDLLKVWNVKVNDCCFDGGYPKSEIDFNTNKRFNENRFWKYKDIKKFRSKCREHNQMVLFKIDPEYK